MPGADAATGFILASESVRDNASDAQNQQRVEIATPRLELALRHDPHPGYQNNDLGRIAGMRDGVITLDDTVPPTGLTLGVHPAYQGYIDRVIGWMGNKLDALASYAADPSIGGGGSD